MNLDSLASELTSGGPGQGSYQHRLTLRIVLRVLADHVRELQFDDGRYLSTIGDFADALRLLAERIRTPEPEPVRTFGNHQLRVRGRSVDQTCPRCGHVHEGISACGVQMGGGGVCPCELEVPA